MPPRYPEHPNYAHDLKTLKARGNELFAVLAAIDNVACSRTRPWLAVWRRVIVAVNRIMARLNGNSPFRHPADQLQWIGHVERSVIGFVPRGDGTFDLNPVEVAAAIPKVTMARNLASAILVHLNSGC